MNESGYGPRPRRRAGIAIAALLGCILAVLPMAQANAVAAVGLTVTSPTFEDDFTLGEVVTITWATNASSTLGGVTGLNIELWNGAASSKIADIKTALAVKPNAFKWTIPMGTATGAYKIKITTTGGTAKSDFSDDPFNIDYGSITGVSPKAADSWRLGDTGRSVKWNNGTATGDIQVDLTDVSGNVVNSTPVRAKIAASAKSFSWDIPVGIATATGSYKLRFLSLLNPNVKGFTAAFTLTLPTIGVTFPSASGINWGIGTSQTIKWTSQAPGSVVIALFDSVTVSTAVLTGGGKVPAKQGTFNYILPLGTVLGASRYKIIVTSYENPKVFDDSDNLFSAVNPTVTVSAPSASTLHTGDKAVAIKWATGVPGKVIIDLLDTNDVKVGNSLSTTATTGTAGTGTFNWDIPLGIASQSGTYKIRVKTTTTPAFSGTSSFTLNVPSITLVDPPSNGWDAGESHTITWTTSTNFVGSVKLVLCTSPGAVCSVELVKSVLVSAKTATFTLPFATAAASYTIQAISVGVNANVALTDTTTAFSISTPTITATQPGAPFTPGAKVTVGFSTTMTGTIKLELVKGSGVVGLIKSGLAASGTSYSWDIPIGFATATGADYKIRVTSLQGSGPAFTADSSAFTFNVPTFTVTPSDSAVWTSPSARSVSWSGFTLGAVKVELYNTANTVKLATLKASATALSGTTSVSVPAGLSAGTYTVRVTSTSNDGIVGTATITI